LDPDVDRGIAGVVRRRAIIRPLVLAAKLSSDAHASMSVPRP
jgi:hypothetical protein